MKIIIAAITVLLLYGCAHGPAQTQCIPNLPDFEMAVDESQAEFRNRLLYAKNGEDLFTGKTIRRYQSGRPESLIQWNCGQLHGISTDWYENGAVKEQCGWEHDRPSGTFRQWNEKGQLVRYVDWTTGECMTWDTSGKLVERELMPSKRNNER